MDQRELLRQRVREMREVGTSSWMLDRKPSQRGARRLLARRSGR